MREASVLKIHNLPLIEAGIRYKFVVPPATTTISIKLRNEATLKVFTSPIDSDYFTLPSDGSYFEAGVIFSGDLYFESDFPGSVVEIITWSLRF